MDYVKRVKNLSLIGSLSDNWRRFKQNYDIFEEAAGISTKTENIRIASFLNSIGEEAVELFNGFDLSVKDRNVFGKIINAFEKHCLTKKLIVRERFTFFSRRQSNNETLASFLADLVRLASTCEFQEQEKSLIRDQFVLGIMNKDLQADLLLLEDDLSFDKIVDLLKILNDHYRTANIIEEESIKIDNGKIELQLEGEIQEKRRSEMKCVHDVCKYCYTKHEYGACPAYGKKCKICSQQNHFAVACKLRKAEFFARPCKRCNSKHDYRQCPAFGKKCSQCRQFNHFAMCCRIGNTET